LEQFFFSLLILMLLVGRPGSGNSLLAAVGLREIVGRPSLAVKLSSGGDHFPASWFFPTS
jgi:hypothetical protein